MPLEKYEGNMKTNDVIDVDAKSPWTGILQGFLMVSFPYNIRISI